MWFLSAGGFGICSLLAVGVWYGVFNRKGGNVNKELEVFLGASDPSLALAVVIFLVIPMLNAFCDALSLGVSRKLLRHLLRFGGSRLRLRDILSHIGIDAALAVLLLVLLSMLLARGSEAVNRLFGDLIIPWMDYADAAYRDPWGEGLAVTIMLLSTLVWTAIHVALLFGALFAEAITWPSDCLYRRSLLNDRWPSLATRVAVVGIVVAAVYIGFLATVGIGEVIVLAVNMIGASFKDILLVVAVWSAGLVATA